MKLFRQWAILVCAGAVLLAHGSVAGPDQEKFVTPPAEGQLQARDAVAPSHLAAYDLTPDLINGVMAKPQLGPAVPPLPDFSAYREVSDRKARFFSYLLPVVEAENARIRGIRTRLLYIREYVRWQQEVAAADQIWLARVFREFRLPEGDPLRPDFWRLLLERVDTLPVELVLVQAANESAWGTSRFAREGNNLFGQWCFQQGCGIVPDGRPAGATYEVARYTSVGESVGSYMRNLNTGQTYQLFRELRARMRSQGLAPDPAALAAGLMDYSARGLDYVTELRAMLRHNADIFAALRQETATEGNG